MRIIVAGARTWNRRVFEERLRGLPGDWTYVETPSMLREEIERAAPDWVFFLHWSHIVPAEIVCGHRCVVFHMADVPYGRGGSPLQNLIERGHWSTVLTALRMTEEVDAGPVYLREPLDLGGTAESILVRSSELAAGMIERIIATTPEPVPQQGEPIVFRRRRPHESELPKAVDNLRRVEDFIRMLDGEGYPPAFVEHGSLRIELRRAARYEGRIIADATITIREDPAT